MTLSAFPEPEEKEDTQVSSGSLLSEMEILRDNVCFSIEWIDVIPKI